MSNGTVSPQFDQFSETSTIVGVDKTREEYLKLFSRASYSPLYDRPYINPISGLYDAINTSTRLVLLNYRFRNSHLREQILPEELSNSSKNNFNYESIFFHEKPKPKPTIKRHSSHIQIDPYRHFESQAKYWHNRRCTNLCSSDNLIDICQVESSMPRRAHTPQTNIKQSTSIHHRRSQSVLSKKDNYYNEPESFLQSFCQYQRNTLHESIPEELSLSKDPIKEEIHQQNKSNNNNRRKLPLTKGQQLYLGGKHNIYDITETKLRRSNSYAQTLTNRYQTDHQCKPQFRLSDSRDYNKYSKYLHPPRSLSPISSSKFKPLITIVSQKTFDLNLNQTEKQSMSSVSIST